MVERLRNGQEQIDSRMSARGAFVQIETGTDGVGKLLDVDADEADVEYFESPAGPRVRRVRVPIAQLRAVELSPQTRVFWFDTDHSAWRAGRVDGGLVTAEALRTDVDHYHVRFPNGLDARVPVPRLYVRWSRPVEDPTDYLANRITDTPFFFEGRSQTVRYLAAQRAAFGGLTGLASAAVDVLEHQVATVRRVLADPTERYLLADEVGLGKTIEAGILIRQHVIDCPQGVRVAVVVPKHLVPQWTLELSRKFFLSDAGGVTVVSQEALLEGEVDAHLMTMLVVDEVHRPALRAFDTDPAERRLYDSLRALAMRVPRVLLISGTPLLHQEDGFLAMLHLLDPDAYPLSDRESFRLRVRERQTIAEATADLVDDASPLFVADALSRLEALSADDRRLSELAATVRVHAASEVGESHRVSALRRLRTHLSETYRLHRRLLRTRRDDPRVRDHLPRRTGALQLAHDDHSRAEAFDFLEAWRLELPRRDDALADQSVHESLFSLFVEAALSHPRVLLRWIDARLALHSAATVPPLPASARALLAVPWVFDGEEELLQTRRQLIADPLDKEWRALRLAEWLSSNRDVRKVVLFVDDREIADSVARVLDEALGPGSVLRHDDGGQSVRTFEETGMVRVLVCDATGEEGLNLQRVGAAIAHYDLPLEAARVEQRVGRVDRIEARGHMRNVVFLSECPYERAWLACLTEAVRVFDRSVAPLQYVFVEAMARIRARLASEGRDAIDAEANRMRDAKGGLDVELRRIRAQEGLDSLEADPTKEAAFFQGLVQADDYAEEHGDELLNSWVVARLQFLRRPFKPRSFRYVHDVRRPTLIPLLETVTRFADSIDRDPEARLSRRELPLLPVTLERAAAEKEGIGLLRVGHPFIAALEGCIRGDDRGAAFAMWRHDPNVVGESRVFFRFDFVIEGDLSKARAVVGSRVASFEALRRRADDAFPVEYRTVWLDADLDEVRDPQVLLLLERPYSRERRADGGRDLNLRLERWARADALVSVGDWTELCFRARKQAEQLLRGDAEFRARCSLYATRTREAGMAAAEGLRSRVARLVGSARESEERIERLESELGEALATGIEEPSVRVDSAGAVFLSRTSLVDE